MTSERRTYRATAERDGPSWLLRMPELGRVTQVRHLDEAEAMAPDLIAIHAGVPADSFDVSIVPDVDEPA